MNDSLNVAHIGFCISENFGIYIANNFVIGFKCQRLDGNYVINLYTPYTSFIIYRHNNEFLNFNTVSNKIVTKIMTDIRYNITNNINIDKIIDEVIKDV